VGLPAAKRDGTCTTPLAAPVHGPCAVPATPEQATRDDVPYGVATRLGSMGATNVKLRAIACGWANCPRLALAQSEIVSINADSTIEPMDLTHAASDRARASAANPLRALSRLLDAHTAGRAREMGTGCGVTTRRAERGVVAMDE